jgi:hypothetical protein
MELRVCMHLTSRDVKIVQPELVYIIEAAPDAVVPLTSSVPQDTDDADVNANDDQPRSRRACWRLGKTGTKTWTRIRPRRTYPTDPTTTTTPTARSLSTSRESALHTRPASDITTGSTSRRSATCAGRTAACPRCVRRPSSRRPCLRPPRPRATSSPSPSRGPSPRRRAPRTPPRPCQGPPCRSHHRSRTRRCRSRLASARRSARSTSHARCVVSWTRCPRGRMNADVDTDDNTPKPLLAMSLPLTFEDKGRD